MIELIQSEFKRRIFEESFVRIENCLGRLTYEQVWQKPNHNANSIGNLVLHLLGNVRQYICSGIGQQKDVRQRSLEFLAESAVPSKELLARLELLKEHFSYHVGQIAVQTKLLVDQDLGFYAGLDLEAKSD